MDNTDSIITGIVVTHNTHDLFKRAYESIRAFHPDMMMIIVDGSDSTDPCRRYVASLEDKKTIVALYKNNIGHGRGLDYALRLVLTPYALCFDSDIEMLKSPVAAMLDMIKPDTYGVGWIELVDVTGHNYGVNPSLMSAGPVKYLHPYFQLIQVSQYKKFKPYIHHGAPCIRAMLDIHKRGLSDKILKEFPGLGHSTGVNHTWKGEPREYIRHDREGTRSVRTQKGLDDIEGAWDKI